MLKIRDPGGRKLDSLCKKEENMSDDRRALSTVAVSDESPLNSHERREDSAGLRGPRPAGIG
jgi:hypothetical protein